MLWSCPAIQIFSPTSQITHIYPTTQLSGTSSSPQTSFFYHTQPIYYRFRCNKSCSFSTCDRNRRCSLLPFPGFLPAGPLSLPHCPGALCSCHPPLRGAQTCHFRHAKQQHFPCKSPSAARQEGLEIPPLAALACRACICSAAGRFAACTSVPLTPAQLLAASRIRSVLLAPGSLSGCLHPHSSCNSQKLVWELQSWGCAPRGSIRPLAPIPLLSSTLQCLDAAEMTA